MALLNEILLTDIMHKSDFVKKDDGGDLMAISGLENVKEALLRRLITEPGSLIHRPSYGVGIKRFLNAPGTLATRQALALRIGEQFPRDPRVESVLGVSMMSDDLQPDRVTIVVRVKLVGYGEQEFGFNLDKGSF
jgi:hypothetical protein